MNNPSRALLACFFAAASLLAGRGTALAATHYVDLNSTNATPPYTNWATAATNIQDAVDAAVSGDQIVVTNGTYATGGRNGNRVTVDKPLSVQSANGPQVTIVSGGGNRCAWLTNGASLSGFSLMNGSVYADSGGGAYGGTLNNCWLTQNSAFGDDDGAGNGGGAAYCTLNNCILATNSVDVYLEYYYSVLPPGDFGVGGGAYYCTLSNCTLRGNSATFSYPGSGMGYGSYGDGGGAANGTLNNCVLTANTARITYASFISADAGEGGGAYRCTLSDSALVGNFGGGAYYSSLDSCTVAGNTNGGGAHFGTQYNCIGFGNHLLVRDITGQLHDGCEDCDSPGRLFYGNWIGDPFFADTNGWANLRLQSNSLCINAGNNDYAPPGPDLDGNPRIVGGTVDIGAYEYQSLSLINFGVVSNQAGFSITGQSNQVVTVETSTDLLNWSPLATNTLNGRPFPFSDPTPATLPQRFYRAQPQ